MPAPLGGGGSSGGRRIRSMAPVGLASHCCSPFRGPPGPQRQHTNTTTRCPGAPPALRRAEGGRKCACAGAAPPLSTDEPSVSSFLLQGQLCGQLGPGGGPGPANFCTPRPVARQLGDPVQPPSEDLCPGVTAAGEQEGRQVLARGTGVGRCWQARRCLWRAEALLLSESPHRAVRVIDQLWGRG